MCRHWHEFPETKKGTTSSEAQLCVRVCEEVVLPSLGKGPRCLEMLHSPDQVGVMATNRLSLNKGLVIPVMSQVNWIWRVTARHPGLSFISDLSLMLDVG